MVSALTFLTSAKILRGFLQPGTRLEPSGPTLLLQISADADVILVNSTGFDESLMAAISRLVCLHRAASGSGGLGSEDGIMAKKELHGFVWKLSWLIRIPNII